jgi:MerR family transcriptional regulator, light-induced transcriptional regulator
VSDVFPSLDAASPQALEQAYLDCLLTPDGRRARALIEQALGAGVPASTVYLRVISPAMEEIGRMWETAAISLAQEHLSTQITQAVIASLALHLSGGEPVGAGRVAAVSSSPGELHAIGAQMVGDFLDAQGWTVLALRRR